MDPLDRGKSGLRKPSISGIARPQLPPPGTVAATTTATSTTASTTTTTTNTTLADITNTDANARNTASMPPPPKPLAKTANDRKTLAQRAAEYQTPARSRPPVSGLNVPGTVRSRSALGNRTPSVGSLRSGGATSRRGSVSSTARPQSAQDSYKDNDVAMGGTEKEEDDLGIPKFKRPKRDKYDQKGRLQDAEDECKFLREQLRGAVLEAREGKTVKFKLMEVEGERAKAETESNMLRRQLEKLQTEIASFELTKQKLEMERDFMVKDVKRDLETMEKRREYEMENMEVKQREILGNMERKHEAEVEDLKRKYFTELDALQRKHREEYEEMERDLRRQLEEERRERERESREAEERRIRETREIEMQKDSEMLALRHTKDGEVAAANAMREQQVNEVQSAAAKEIAELKAQAQAEVQRLMHEMGTSGEQIQALRREVKNLEMELEREKMSSSNLMEKLSEANKDALNLESTCRALRARIELLESDSSTQAQSAASLAEKYQQSLHEINQLHEKLRNEETVRRKLHNQIQELKGNIRVFCRIRPPLEGERNVAEMSLPDSAGEGQMIEIKGAEEKTSMGTVVTKTHPFQFDKVFGPDARNEQVFEEISQLVQSALDGYNVCIFAYGQTGSGKTHTMSSEDGMIPRAVHMIYSTASSLKDRGWTYAMEGSFLEVYNENINDLLGKADDYDKKKHEIRHDPKEMKTTVTDITTVMLDSPQKVDQILRRAASNRSVAATKANERSSRSHSVFILKLIGTNSITGEKSHGTLNLVDLAGSERLSHSQASGDRLKETQSINKSLSCLGDVISALGAAGKDGSGAVGHVPYRNSKLTYLLQYSLGGNSKTLMFVMVSPLKEHLNETVTSLKFATKVGSTYVGTAKKRVKRESE